MPDYRGSLLWSKPLCCPPSASTGVVGHNIDRCITQTFLQWRAQKWFLNVSPPVQSSDCRLPSRFSCESLAPPVQLRTGAVGFYLMCTYVFESVHRHSRIAEPQLRPMQPPPSTRSPSYWKSTRPPVWSHYRWPRARNVTTEQYGSIRSKGMVQYAGHPRRAYFFFGRTFDLVSGLQCICACVVPHPLCT